MKHAAVTVTDYGFAALSGNQLWMPDLRGSYKSVQVKTLNPNRIAWQQPVIVAVGSSGGNNLELVNILDGQSRQVQLPGRIIHLQSAQSRQLYVSLFSGNIQVLDSGGNLHSAARAQTGDLLNGFAVANKKLFITDPDPLSQ